MDDESLKTLLLKLGEPYLDFDDELNYLGCFAPMYVFYSDVPRFKLPKDEWFEFALGRLVETFVEKSQENLEVGDILVFEF